MREVLTHPVRQRIMAELDEAGVAPDEVSRTLGMDRRSVADPREAGRVLDRQEMLLRFSAFPRADMLAALT
ncbi:MAG: hypothetical protein AUI14_12100 [Actinobacteria bacterium 13_2_20CM_2_71_6]|nr:MAG: hypothetical protein AUI14_12100 [Actinobacteria bacterium 13_2_20CM_2_71_6]